MFRGTVFSGHGVVFDKQEITTIHRVLKTSKVIFVITTSNSWPKKTPFCVLKDELFTPEDALC